jgi:hypothetical protein
VFNASSRAEADRLLGLTIAAYVGAAPRVAAWMADAVPGGLKIFDVLRGTAPPA